MLCVRVHGSQPGSQQFREKGLSRLRQDSHSPRQASNGRNRKEKRMGENQPGNLRGF